MSVAAANKLGLVRDLDLCYREPLVGQTACSLAKTFNKCTNPNSTIFRKYTLHSSRIFRRITARPCSMPSLGRLLCVGLSRVR